MGNNNFNEKSLQFVTALSDCYKDEVDRESFCFFPISLSGGQNVTEDLRLC